MDNQEKVKIIEMELSKFIQNVEKEYGLRMEMDIIFPMYNQLPIEVQLALVIIKNHGGVIKAQYTPVLPSAQPKEEEHVAN